MNGPPSRVFHGFLRDRMNRILELELAAFLRGLAYIDDLHPGSYRDEIKSSLGRLIASEGEEIGEGRRLILRVGRHGDGASLVRNRFHVSFLVRS